MLWIKHTGLNGQQLTHTYTNTNKIEEGFNSQIKCNNVYKLYSLEYIMSTKRR